MPEADLEIGLHKDGFKYRVEVRFSSPETDAANIDDFVQGEARFDKDDVDVLAEFRELATSPDYGGRLAQWVFHDPAVQETFTNALAAADAKTWTVGVRILIGPSAPELHTLNWERLAPGPSANPLALRADRVHLSRYLFSRDWRKADRRARGPLRGLLAVANPKGLPEGLAAVDVAEAVAACSEATSQSLVPLVSLVNPGEASRARILEELQKDPGVDLLFLVCHGRFAAGDTQLYLEDSGGGVDRCSGTELASLVGNLSVRPRLVVLLSCDSSGRGLASQQGEQLGAVAPRLASAGVPAVLGVQGSVSQAAAATFLRGFLARTVESGDLGRALAESRQLVYREPDDWWKFVLYTRVPNGQIWYTPRAALEPDNDFWIRVRAYVSVSQQPTKKREKGRTGCIPILGSELTERLLGSTREIARRWAKENAIPVGAREADSLPQLAQYLDNMRGREASLDGEHGLFSFLRTELVGRYEEVIRQEQAQRGEPELTRAEMLDPGHSLHELISAVGRSAMRRDPDDPHRILARLRLPLYVTASPLSLMSDALEIENICAETAAYPWRRLARLEYPLEGMEEWPLQLPSYDRWTLDPQKPLVYHLFGVLRERSSLAITEDDFIDYLVNFLNGADDLRAADALRARAAGGQEATGPPGGAADTTRTACRFPAFLLAAFRSSAVFLTGFSFEDWSFRVLVRSLHNLGTFSDKKIRHVAVQVHPDESRGMSVAATERYLERYFQNAQIGLFMGSARDFTAKLADMCR
jgi:hypothetical protein